MFEAAELGQAISRSEFRERLPALRQDLLSMQRRLERDGVPLIVLFEGVDKAGKGDTANQLTYWMDPRRVVTRAYVHPTQEEEERPEYWRYWRDLPRKGYIGMFLSAWYSRPFLDRVYERSDDDRFHVELEHILAFERTLASDDALILKFWMHLGKDAQRKRFEELQADPLQRWRIEPQDWKHLQMYDRFIAAAEHLVIRTSVASAPWTIVEGADPHYRSMRVGTSICEAVDRHLAKVKRTRKAARRVESKPAEAEPAGTSAIEAPATVLDRLDMSLSLENGAYERRLRELQGRIHTLRRRALGAQVSTILVFEGWDASGKGGAIRRLIEPLDARNYQVISIGPPTDEELGYPYLWRFWHHLPRAGRLTIFDRSWYGRVLVERVEGFATEAEWRRAYAEINDFEQQLAASGVVIVKFWMHITRSEQKRRFKRRLKTPHKRWKLTEEDWRNRHRWREYVAGVNDMVERTSTAAAPWVLVEGDSKRYARIRVLEAVCEALEDKLGLQSEATRPPDAAGVTG